MRCFLTYKEIDDNTIVLLSNRGDLEVTSIRFETEAVRYNSIRLRLVDKHRIRNELPNEMLNLACDLVIR